MSRLPWCALPILLAAAMHADVTLPQGKEFLSLDIPPADSFVVSGFEVHSYVDMKFTGLQAIQYFGIVFPEGGYQLDTVQKTITTQIAGYLRTEDSAGLQWAARFEAGTGALGVASETKRHFDSQRRPVLEITTIFYPEDRGESYDTIQWTWSHPGCADDLKNDTLRVWSVDAQGRCSTAEVMDVAEGGRAPTGYTDHIVWNGSAIAAAYRLEGTDTLLKDVFSVDGNGNVTEDISWEKWGSTWVLTDRDTFVYRDGKLDRVVQTSYEDGRPMHRMVYQSTRGTTGVVVPRRASSRWIEARREGEMVVFENRSAQAVAIELRDANGRQVGRLQVAPGSRASWTGRVGQVFWKAKAVSWEASGRLAPRF